MSNMYPFTHPMGACNSGVIRARESRRLTSGTATIWTLSGIVLAACNHSSNNDTAITAVPSPRAAVWLADPRPEDAGKTGVRLVFAYDLTNPPAEETMRNLATELHITRDEIRDGVNTGELASVTNAAATGTITATAIDADGNPVLDPDGNPVRVAGQLVLVSPTPAEGDGIVDDRNDDDNVVQWAYTPSTLGDARIAGAEARYLGLTFRFIPADEDTYASPTINMNFKIGGSQPVLNPVLRSDKAADDETFTITQTEFRDSNPTDASGTIQIVIDGIIGDPIDEAGQFTVTSNLGPNREGGDGGYYGDFTIIDNTGRWTYDINPQSLPGGTVTEIISITYTPNVLTDANGQYRLYQESNTIDLVFTIMDEPAPFVSEAYIDDTPPPDAPPPLDVI